MFQVIFKCSKSSSYFLIEFCKSWFSPLLSAVGGTKFSKTSAWSCEWGTGAWVKMPRFNAIYGTVNVINLFFSHTWWSIQVTNNSTSLLERGKAKKVKEIWIKHVYLRLILKDKCVKQYYLPIVGSNLGVRIFLKKREHQKKGALKQRNEARRYTLYWGFKVWLLFYCLFLLFLGYWISC